MIKLIVENVATYVDDITLSCEVIDKSIKLDTDTIYNIFFNGESLGYYKNTYNGPLSDKPFFNKLESVDKLINRRETIKKILKQ